jgi:hypothetical protein
VIVPSVLHTKQIKKIDKGEKKGMYVVNEVSIQTPQKCPRLNTAKTESKIDVKFGYRKEGW